MHDYSSLNRGGALGRVQHLRRQYCWVTQVNLTSYSLNMMSTVDEEEEEEESEKGSVFYLFI